MDDDKFQQLIHSQNELRDNLKNISKTLSHIFQLLVVAFVIGLLGLFS